MLSKIFKHILPVAIICTFSIQVQADSRGGTTTTSGSIVSAPQNHLSDFPNEYISAQSRKVKFVYNDIVIPGNAGMDIVVTRTETGAGGKIQETVIKTSNTFASDDLLFSRTCLGDFKRLHINYDGRVLSNVGFKSSDIPDSVIAAFDNYSYVSCDEVDNKRIILHLPNGRKYTFVKVNYYATNYSNGSVYKVHSIVDRHGNSIIYEYEDGAFSYSDDRIKTISRNDGQIVNFAYQADGDLKEITYSGNKIQYALLNGIKTVTDAVGRQTKFEYGMYTGIGNQIRKVTTPEGLTAEYEYSPLLDNGSMRLPVFGDANIRTSFSLADFGYSGGNLTLKNISGPNIDNRYFMYHNLTGSIGSTKFIAIESNDINSRKLATVFTIAKTSALNQNGQVLNIKHYEGEFILHNFIQNPNENTTLLYEQDNSWTAIESGSVGCNSATRIGYSEKNCNNTLWEMSSKAFSINKNGEYDEYISTVTSFDTYGQPLVIKENFGINTKVTMQTYAHDVNNWILNQPLITSIGATITSVINTKEFTYYDKNHASYPFMPYEVKSFGVWQKRYATYHLEGEVNKIEYNEFLANGKTKRYELLSNYKRGIAQTTTVPNRYSNTEIISTRQVDDNGWITQTQDLNRNTVNLGYDGIGRLKYIDPVDMQWADTLYSWSYNGGTNNNQPKLVVSRCTLSTDKKSCNGTANITDTTNYDVLMRPVEKITTDISNYNSVYNNYGYDHHGNLKFSSFLSNTSGETSGTTYLYDKLQRLSTEIVSNGGTKTTSYLSGNKIRVNDFNSNQTTTTYLAYGAQSYQQPTLIASPEGITTSLSVNVFGEVESITQSGAHKSGSIMQTQVNLYNSTHQLCMVKRNDVGNTYYQRDNLGKLVWQAQGVSGTTCAANGATTAQRTNFRYDNLGDLHTITYGDASPGVTYTLDKNGDVTDLISGNVTQTYGYNSARLLEWETLAVDTKLFTLDYAYNSLGHLDSLTYPYTGKVDFAPNAFGQATKAMSTSQSYATSATYYPNGMIDGFTFGNGIVHKTTLNNRNLPANITDASTGTNRVTAVNLAYTYDDQNNVKSITNGIDSRFSLSHLNYDGLDRLTSTTGNAGIGDSNIVYDGLGNITSYSTLNSDKNSNLTYTYNTTSNRLTGVSGTGAASYNFNSSNSYDGRGNVTNNGMRHFDYNVANQMTDSGNNHYVYDGYNRRVKTSDSKGISYSMYSQGGQLLYRETTEGGISYIFLGNKLIAKDGSGVKIATVSSKMHYKPFGESIEQAKDDVGYTGHKFDADLGLSYMQARYYDPVIGRFYSNDPVGFTGDITSFNRYSYVGNNPYKYTDPDGQNRLLVMGARLAKNPTRAPKMISRAVRSFAEGLGIISPVRNEGSNVGSGVNPDVPDATDGIKEGKSPAIGGAGAKGQLEGGGGQAGALEDLGSIPLEGGTEWSSPDGSRQGGTLGDGSGRKANVHPSGGGDSYPQGTPTLEVQKPNGKTEIKIRYPEN